MEDSQRLVRFLRSIGVQPTHIYPISNTNNAVVEVLTPDGKYILKSFEKKRLSAYQRELGMRKLLKTVEGIAYPQILHTGDHQNRHFILMEKVIGNRLETRW